MSFYCRAKKEVVIGVARELIPSVVRKVAYIGSRKNFRGFPDGEPEITFGWEIVKCAEVSKDLADQYKIDNPPTVLDGEKKVLFEKPPKKKIPFKKTDEDEDDKGEWGQ